MTKEDKNASTKLVLIGIFTIVFFFIITPTSRPKCSVVEGDFVCFDNTNIVLLSRDKDTIVLRIDNLKQYQDIISKNICSHDTVRTLKIWFDRVSEPTRRMNTIHFNRIYEVEYNGQLIVQYSFFEEISMLIVIPSLIVILTVLYLIYRKKHQKHKTDAFNN